ncbi:5-(carboxyamino)imidazole ribonucleotide synthase [Erysipelotrichaceae bacterium OttesenSCG-928-M19]|nr:5-(carboxyamino)imidazole ribonucleotide synthase [Erysipelotrichaceae bacterium OttesenSCG-928-M19]
MRIGIIGGGQLGMFLALQAYEMGHESIVYDCKADCCAKTIASKFYLGSFDDEEKLEEFAKECDVITYEFENINSAIVKKLATKYPILQKEHPLVIASSRYNERMMANKLQIRQPRWQLIKNKVDLKKIELNYPYLLKSISLGYDGKGQYLIKEANDLEQVSFNNKVEYLAEEMITFDYEMSLIAIRSLTNEYAIYEPFYNIHHQGILNITLIDEDIPTKVVTQAKEAIQKIMDQEAIYGILCCEFFVKDDVVYFNEMACRPHNSGHITMDTHYVSQYENHLRALLGLPLGTTAIKTNGFMVNVLGQDTKQLTTYLSDNYAYSKYYDYHKEPRDNRKIGHLVVFDKNKLNYFKKEWR